MAKKIPTTRQAAHGASAAAKMMVESFDRMQAAKVIYEFQDDATRDAIDRMQSLLIRQARRYAWVGNKKDRVSFEIPKDAIWNNALYMAIEILKDLAYMDIRVANFRWPSDTCMSCGKPVKTKTRKKVRA